MSKLSSICLGLILVIGYLMSLCAVILGLVIPIYIAATSHQYAILIVLPVSIIMALMFVMMTAETISDLKS